MRRLHFLVPGLFWPDAHDARPYEGLSLPGLETLLTRGRRRPEPVDGYEGWLASAFGFDPASAPLAALAAAAQPGDDGVWMHADPVHLSARGAELFLTAGEAIGIEALEATALVARLNEFFHDDGLEFRMLRPDRWVLRTRTAGGDLRTTALSAAHGRAIDPLLPRGDGALPWLRLLNEAQMLLHGHGVNEAREARGLPGINSLWFSSPGVRAVPPAPTFDAVLSADPVTTGLGRAAALRVEATSAPLASAIAAATRGRALVQVMHCWEAAAMADATAWGQALATLDADGLAPAILALRAGALDSVALTGFGGRGGCTLTLGRLDLLRFWRRHRALAPAEALA